MMQSWIADATRHINKHQLFLSHFADENSKSTVLLHIVYGINYFILHNKSHQVMIELISNMNTIIENLCKHGTVSFDFSEKSYTIIFEPHTKNSLPEQIQSTVLIVRNSPREAATALNQFITNKKHWSEYPEAFWVTSK